MPKSMTAFARQESAGEWGSLTVELRSVNHRYLEVSLRLPDDLRSLEPALRERVQQALGRGKVDLGVRYQAPAAAGGARLNHDLAQQIAHLSRELDGVLYNPAPVSSLELLKWPGVLEAPATDAERLASECLSLLDRALTELSETRAREGAKLGALIEQRCDAMADVVRNVRERLPQVHERLRQRLTDRLAEVKGELDPARLEQEMVIFATKCDVDEELDRLGAHLSEVRRVVGRDEPVGRRLDFLMQELHREANTLGSKSADTETTRASVDLKVYIEQMREQVQNIE